ncbi:type VII secretion-associated protein [Mycobacterium montefiorense]|uniref:Type VII secretion-associated protein n=1 Tax=Mycobacterium montefiorense TaxID=154654 RepID=A0AA37PPI5_9MYCO|nr:type VII secretion-associated protein [Mycobacterium montefiorense]GBG36884.1 type VII secretion-associated protein [Mycobacterium montefiorense]GKU46374.1 type VII secretion-associated protein [Mycobacterium montefiorense]GKU67511.1 type VII secretion-associated protein [Mycobacterium montefiorense]GKU72973.1 type VII secretion-associated protein [Mycobacterium montefiorense]
MSAHRTIIGTGPGTIRRLCCGTGKVADDMSEVFRAALEAIDDQVALVDGRPVDVDSLWPVVLRSLDCGKSHVHRAIQVVYPSWWPSSRVGVVAAAAATLPGDIQLRPRSWLLRQVANAQPEAPVVEIAERLVAISIDDVVAVPRAADPDALAENISRLIGEIESGTASSILIDASGAVGGARALAQLIAGRVRRNGHSVVAIDDAGLSRLTASMLAKPKGAARLPPSVVDASHVRSRVRIRAGLVAAAIVLAATGPAVAAGGRRAIPPLEAAPTTFLVEGRVALTVPANWRTERVVVGPGSARVQVSSPSDPEVALHITQSRIPDETLSATAERLKRAINTEPGGVFVDFNPSGVSAGRPAVTYREVRSSHQVRWTVVVDGSVRISVGCQSRPAGEEAVRVPCEQAVRSAHAIG